MLSEQRPFRLDALLLEWMENREELPQKLCVDSPIQWEGKVIVWSAQWKGFFKGGKRKLKENHSQP